MEHLLRELDGFAEFYTPDKKTAPTAKHPHPDFARAARCLRGAVHKNNQAIASGVPPGEGRYAYRLGKILADIESSYPVGGRRTSTDRTAFALVRRLRRLIANKELFAFLIEFDVPPTIYVRRPAKLALRTPRTLVGATSTAVEGEKRRSGCFRSEVAARQWLRIAGYIDTSRKAGRPPIEALRLAAVGTPVMP